MMSVVGDGEICVYRSLRHRIHLSSGIALVVNTLRTDFRSIVRLGLGASFFRKNIKNVTRTASTVAPVTVPRAYVAIILTLIDLSQYLKDASVSSTTLGRQKRLPQLCRMLFTYLR